MGVGKLGLVLIAALMLLAAGCAQNISGGAQIPAAPPRVLIGIAASDGIGIGATNPDRDNWVAQLGSHLPDGTRVLNLGISGATALQAAEQELPVAADAAPAIVAIWLGVNDFQQRVPLAQFSASLSQIANTLRARPGTHTYIGNLPDLRFLKAFSEWDQAALEREVARWNAEIARIARDAGASLVDIYDAWAAQKDHGELVSGDGLHPNTAGYQRIADLFWQFIRVAA